VASLRDESEWGGQAEAGGFVTNTRVRSDFLDEPFCKNSKDSRFSSGRSIPFTIVDKQTMSEEIALNKTLELYGYQTVAVEGFADKEQGILVAPPGSGKTIMGL